jgi:very-short-patch-repair endonuclease
MGYKFPKTTEPQLELWRRLKTSLWGRGLVPELEYTVDGDKVDIAIPELRIAIEVDGGYHTRWEQRLEDERRDNARSKAGWAFIRVTNKEIERNIELVSARSFQWFVPVKGSFRR